MGAGKSYEVLTNHKGWQAEQIASGSGKGIWGGEGGTSKFAEHQLSKQEEKRAAVTSRQRVSTKQSKRNRGRV